MLTALCKRSGFPQDLIYSINEWVFRRHSDGFDLKKVLHKRLESILARVDAVITAKRGTFKKLFIH